MAAAARSVTAVFILLIGEVYIFGVGFRILSAAAASGHPRDKSAVAGEGKRREGTSYIVLNAFQIITVKTIQNTLNHYWQQINAQVNCEQPLLLRL